MYVDYVAVLRCGNTLVRVRVCVQLFQSEHLIYYCEINQVIIFLYFTSAAKVFHL